MTPTINAALSILPQLKALVIFGLLPAVLVQPRLARISANTYAGFTRLDVIQVLLIPAIGLTLLLTLDRPI